MVFNEKFQAHGVPLCLYRNWQKLVSAPVDESQLETAIQEHDFEKSTVAMSGRNWTIFERKKEIPQFPQGFQNSHTMLLVRNGSVGTSAVVVYGEKLDWM